ncbi:hypothetical protein [Streptomyces griseocarneus]|uniref:hypothetical protein n=1 Tax=Streptomyces griseocarneus TaxID=51201 RepID=UPI00167D9447|nr:hypothetical protein [Streptomyces griseocarneus]MBZ6476724.1 hypothetical protein [Streptomyces griseocarneus]GHG80551.1 hypothetical protein GCM10018779_62220 [Streptomyces griseocarneus]
MSDHARTDGTEGIKEIGEWPGLQFVRAGAAGLVDGNIIDDTSNRVRLSVETLGPRDQLTLRLVLGDECSYWKTMPVKTHIGGTWVSVGELGVNSKFRISTINRTLDELGGTLQLDFWKSGFLGLGAWVTARTLDVTENLGKRLTFTWLRE